MTGTPSLRRPRRTVSRGRTKRLLAAVLLIGLVAGTGGLLVLTGQITLQSSTGASVSSGLHEVATVPPNADHLVSWQPDAWTSERALEPATRASVAAGYIRAWAAMGRIESTGETAAVVDTFSGPARRSVLDLPRTGESATWALQHSLELEFYALDGATVAFRDLDATLARSVGSGAAQTVLLSDESYDVVMVLEDGFWRVRQLSRSPESTTATVSTDADGTTSTSGTPSHRPRAVPAGLATEYTSTVWASEETATGAVEVAADFARLRELGVDTIRLPLPFDEIGGATPTTPAVAWLGTILDEAGRQGLGVDLVLFEGLDDLSPVAWVGADAQLTAIVTAVGSHPAVALWDLADRPDLRVSGGASPTEIRAFLVHTGALLRELDPLRPLTISWSTAAAASDEAMAAEVDVIGLHLVDGTDPAEDLRTVGSALPGRDVVLTVTGLTTDGGWGPIPRTVSRQAADVAEVRLAAERAGVDHLSVASFRDTAADSGGLLRTDGSAKPAALLFGPLADLTADAQIDLLDYVTSRFAGVIAAGLLAVAAVTLLHRQRARNRLFEG